MMKLAEINPREKVDPATRKMLLSSVERMSRYVDLGMDPTEALKKTASEDRLLPDQIRLVGRAFNTAQVLTQGGKGRNVLEKTASRPLSDPEKVVDELWSGEKAEFALLEKTSSFVDDYYRRDPELNLRELVKQASPDPSPFNRIGERQQIVIGGPYPAPSRRNPEPPVENLRLARMALQLEASRLNDRLEKIARYLAAAVPGTRELLEQSVRANLPDRAYRWVKQAADELSRSIPFKGVHGVPRQFDEELREAVRISHNVERAARRIKQAKEKLEVKIDAPGKLKEVTDLSKSLAPGELDLDALRKEISEDIDATPTVRRVKDDEIIMDMLVSDPSLSSYTVEEAREAMKDIRRMFPKLSKQPVVAKTLLRKYLTYGGLDPAEIRNLYQVEQMAQGKNVIKIGEIKEAGIWDRVSKWWAERAARKAAQRAAYEKLMQKPLARATVQDFLQAQAGPPRGMFSKVLGGLGAVGSSVLSMAGWIYGTQLLDSLMRGGGGGYGEPYMYQSMLSGEGGGGQMGTNLLRFLGNPLVTGIGGLALGGLFGGGKGALIGGLGGFLLPLIIGALMRGGQGTQSLQMQQLGSQQTQTTPQTQTQPQYQQQQQPQTASVMSSPYMVQ